LPRLCRRLPSWLLALLLLAAPTAAASPEGAVRLLDEAESATWFALNDEGDLDTFDRGLELLAGAEEAIASLPAGPEREALAQRATALRADLEWQREAFHDKLTAVFPLVRYYRTTLLYDADALGSHELFDDPRERAAEQALKGLLLLPLSGLPQRPQLDAVFATRPADGELEASALAFFNRLPGYFAHNRQEVAQALLPLDPTGALAAAANRGELAPAAAAALMAAFGAERLLLVTLEKRPAFDEEQFYFAEARVFGVEQGLTLAAEPVTVMGFGRERTHLVAPLALINLLLWVLAVALHQRLRGGRFDASDLVAPSLAFAFGRIAPWLILPLLGQIRPGADMLAPAGAWWPALAGAALLLLPIAAVKLVGPRLPVIAPYLAWNRGLESLALGIACGAAAWWATPLLALEGLGAGLGAFLLALPALLGAAWLLARFVGGALAQAWFAPFVALALALSIATAEVDWIAAGLALTAAGVMVARQRRGVAAEERATPLQLAASYRPLGVLPQLEAVAFPALTAGRVAWLAVTGPAGSGKTLHLRALVAKLAALEDERPFLLLDGACERLADGAGVPFGPFQRCLAQHLKLDVARLAGGGAAEGLTDLLLGPLAPLFSGSSGLAASERDLFAFVAKALRQQAAHARVCLVIDDAQWLDEASAGLLAHLQEALPTGAPGALVVLLAGRREGDDDLLARLLPATLEIALQPPGPAELQELLRQGHGLSPAVADWILDWLGARRGQAVLAGTLSEVVEQLGRAQALAAGSEGLTFSASFDPERPPLAASALAEVTHALDALPQARDTLAVAACLGRRFEAGLIAGALGQSRQAVLKDLQVLEHETGLVRDVLAEDDVFEFRSQRGLDAVREALSLRLKGPRADDVPQTVRELHALIAAALAPRAQASLADLLSMATHWYGAGRGHAAQAVAANLAAARKLAGLLRFGEAETFLAQAAEGAAFSGLGDAVAATRIWLAAERAHVTGEGARGVALRGLEFLAGPAAGQGDPWTLLAVARACYEASRDGGPSLLAEAERLGLAVAAGGGDALARAQGLHLAGLALRFDATRREEGRRRLAEALALAEGEGSVGELLAGQIANSLALLEQGRGTAGHAAAEALFRRSLAAKQRQAIPDRPGLARSYSGLGLLLLEAGEPGRLAEAEELLQRGLAIAGEIGDRSGLSKARLWLGRGRLLQGDPAAAAELFQAVVAQAFSAADIATAEAGLLEAAAATGDRAGYLDRATRLAERFARQPVPAESRPALRRALAWPAAAGEAVVADLLAALEATP